MIRLVFFVFFCYIGALSVYVSPWFALGGVVTFFAACVISAFDKSPVEESFVFLMALVMGLGVAAFVSAYLFLAVFAVLVVMTVAGVIETLKYDAERRRLELEARQDKP